MRLYSAENKLLEDNQNHCTCMHFVIVLGGKIRTPGRIKCCIYVVDKDCRFGRTDRPTHSIGTTTTEVWLITLCLIFKTLSLINRAISILLSGKVWCGFSYSFTRNSQSSNSSFGAVRKRIYGGHLKRFARKIAPDASCFLRRLSSKSLVMGLWVSLLSALISSCLSLVLLSAASAVILGRRRRRKAVGFFHPYTNDGGGGERVLWCAVKAIQEDYPDLDCAIFTGDDASPQSLAGRALDRFGVRLLRPPQVVRLHRRKWVDEHTYPRFTMIGQSLGSVYLSWEALCKFTPQVYLDTSGYAFTYPLARVFGCKVICYTHYPTISSDMVSRVLQFNSMYNNDALIANSVLLSRCKVVYYTLFSWLYGLVGSCAHLAMVNSSWTRSHIEKLWRIPQRTKRVYPPCDTSSLQMLPLERSVENPVFISVAQFRPEKAHALQLEAFALVIERLKQDSSPIPKLQFVGSCRNKQDEARLQKLKDRSRELNIDNYVEFHRDVMYRDLVHLLGGAVVGLHSMIDEHFGIVVVEYMAAGVIPIANNSAGPKMDIVLEEDGRRTGFLAAGEEEYAEAIRKVLEMPECERLAIATAARERASRFSERKFFDEFKVAVRPILAPKTSS